MPCLISVPWLPFVTPCRIFAIAVYSLVASLLGTARPCRVRSARLVFKAPVWYRCILFTRQEIYVKRNTEARSCNHSCSEQAISINSTYSESMSVALVIEHAMCMRHSVTCGLPIYNIFFTRSQKRHDFQEKKLLNIKSV